MDNLLIEIRRIVDSGYTLEFAANGEIRLVSDRLNPWPAPIYPSQVFLAIRRANAIGVTVAFYRCGLTSGIEIRLSNAGKRITWYTPWLLIEQSNLDIVSFDIGRNSGLLA